MIRGTYYWILACFFSSGR